MTSGEENSDHPQSKIEEIQRRVEEEQFGPWMIVE
ncbi:hypothetical protein Golax_000802, partial [Gossypium laxum]|nr:hypothetical protein [Gossypium laxum]